MAKYTFNFEIDYTYKELFVSADILFVDKDTICFNMEKICIPLSVKFVASRLSRIEKRFGERQFMMCKLRIDEAYENYKQSINKKDEGEKLGKI